MSPRSAALPVIGVLGGMGPEATVAFMRRVIATTPADDDQDHIRMLVDHNPKVPSRIAALIEKTGDDPSPELITMARRLEAGGASLLAMPCNTAHAYAGAIRGAVAIPLLDMVALTANRISRMMLEHRRVGLLASSAVRSLGLYERVLAPLGISIVYPEDQAGVMRIIKAVKRGDTGADLRRQLGVIASGLIGRKCDLLLIACTELSLLADSLDDAAAMLDSLDVLVEEVVACGLGSRAIPMAVSGS